MGESAKDCGADMAIPSDIGKVFSHMSDATLFRGKTNFLNSKWEIRQIVFVLKECNLILEKKCIPVKQTVIYQPDNSV